MRNNSIIEELKVQPLSEEEKASKHILKRLAGPIASCKDATRNQRHYNRELWEKALSDEIMAEKIRTKSLFLELGHPTDRDETDMTCVCACIPEMPKIIGDDLYATVDVLDTTNGRLLSNLIDYGFVPGISSRGTGDLIGDEVDPDSFFLETWDIVQIPALEKARLQVVEGLKQKENPFKQALTESLNKANEEDKKVMEQAMENLGIDVDEKKSLNENINTSNSANIKVDSNIGETNIDSAVKDNEAKQLVSSLQESLKSKVLLETKVQKLQEDLAVSDTKVKQLQEELNKYKGLVVNMTKYASENKDLKKDIVSLEEKLASQEKTITLQEKRIETLVDKVHLKETKAKDLRENYNSTSNEVKSLQEKLASSEVAHKNEIKQLKEQLKETNANLEIKENELSTKLAKASKLIEKYKGFVNTTVDRYIESKAVMLGVTPNEIKNRLSESYTLDEVDKVCESLQDFNLRISKLPFNVEKGTRIGITESKKSRYEEVSAEEDISNLAKFIKEN